MSAATHWRIAPDLELDLKTPRIMGILNVTPDSFSDGGRYDALADAVAQAERMVAEGAAIIDIGGGVRLPGNLGVGIGFSRFDTSNDASVDARLPHPFFFDRHRAIAGSAPGLTRTETAIHLQLRWFAPVPDQLELSVFGGPSFFNVTQGLVTAVGFSQSYPFDAASFTEASTGEQSKSAVGYNIGADVGYFFSRHVGVGALVRFSGASVELLSQDEGRVSIDLGGLHAGGGLRLRF